jgi:microcystin-dependent protein
MGYTSTIWKEWGMSTGAKVTALNNLEGQYAAAIADLTAHDHDDLYYTKAEAAKYFTQDEDGHNSGMVAEFLDGATAQQIMDASIASGIIAYWPNSEASIPAGFKLCNGSSGTPDLRGRFIVGAGGAYSAGSSGGFDTINLIGTLTIATHALTIAEMPAHAHAYNDTRNYQEKADAPGGVWLDKDCYGSLSGIYGHGSTTASTGSGTPHGHPGSSITFAAIDNRPPFYALLYIMKS